MAEQQNEKHVNKGAAAAPESTDRGCGLFNFMGKKEENKASAQDDTAMMDVVDTTPNVVEPAPKEEKHSLMEKLHRTHSNSSSSSDEEEVVDEVTGEKKRKKKGLKEKIKEKFSGDEHKESSTDHQQKVDSIMENYPPVPAHHHVSNANGEAVAHENHEEKKGFMEKIKDKLPGHNHNNKTEQGHGHPMSTSADHEHHGGCDQTTEKKGFLDKIKEKLPGGHHKTNELDDHEKHKSN